jgi:Protein of unknown function (DUF3224)
VRSLTATFEIENWDENPALETESGSRITRADVTRSFDGDLEGEGTVEWLMAYDEDAGSAVFVGLERVVGSLAGKSGTFVLQHVGTFDGQTARADLVIVPGSGTGDLEGVRGRGSFQAGLGPDGERHIALEVDIPGGE